MSKDIPIVCFCIIFHQEKILLLKRSPTDKSHPNTWWLPGGHLEKGETLEQGVIREVFEESDILLDPKDTQLVLQDVSTNGKPLFLFTATTDNPFVALKDGEHTEYAWVNPCDVLQYTCNPILFTYINEVLMFHSSAHGLTSLSAPGSSYAEAAVSTAPSGPAIKMGQLQNVPSRAPRYAAPIIYRKNCANCGGQGYGGASCGCESKKVNPLSGLFLSAHDKPIVYGSLGNLSAKWSELATTKKVALVFMAIVLLHVTKKNL
jgi:8-oxo-dGTP pyrophosphatase MutT (NUDIX family)